ncbi:MAG: sigma-70 family RNA polymerase sigma factor [Anaerolineae bacterium]|nr:sigma-70 family RNA polymerase sigma factor [Anaerolineae bacterium]
MDRYAGGGDDPVCARPTPGNAKGGQNDYNLLRIFTQERCAGSNSPMMSDDGVTRADTQYPYQVWIESIRDRDPASWDVLIDSFADQLRADIRISLLKQRLPVELLEDVSQETWLTAFRNIHTFVWEDEERFYRWLRVIACNHIYRARRHAGREQSVDEYEEGENELRPFFELYHLQGRGVEDEVEAGEQMLALAQAMKMLKAEEREILVRWLMGETPRVLAADYQKQPRTISVTIWRAKQKVEASLAAIQAGRNRKGVSLDDTQ